MQGSNEGVTPVERSLSVDVSTPRTRRHCAHQLSSSPEMLTPSEMKGWRSYGANLGAHAGAQALQNPPGGPRFIEPETPDVLVALQPEEATICFFTGDLHQLPN